jgi:hypothetical protein
VGEPAADSGAPPAPPPAPPPVPNPYAPPDLSGPPNPYAPPNLSGAAQPVAAGTNGLAIAAFVLGLVGWLVCVGSLLAVIFGSIARNQIRRSGDRQQGAGMATAGIILGAIGLVLWLVYLVLAIALASQSTDI